MVLSMSKVTVITRHAVQNVCVCECLFQNETHALCNKSSTSVTCTNQPQRMLTRHRIMYDIYICLEFLRFHNFIFRPAHFCIKTWTFTVYSWLFFLIPFFRSSVFLLLFLLLFSAVAVNFLVYITCICKKLYTSLIK